MTRIALMFSFALTLALASPVARAVVILAEANLTGAKAQTFWDAVKPASQRAGSDSMYGLADCAKISEGSAPRCTVLGERFVELDEASSATVMRLMSDLIFPSGPQTRIRSVRAQFECHDDSQLRSCILTEITKK